MIPQTGRSRAASNRPSVRRSACRVLWHRTQFQCAASLGPSSRRLLYTYIPVPESALVGAGPCVRSVERTLPWPGLVHISMKPRKGVVQPWGGQYHISLSRPLVVYCDDVRSLAQDVRRHLATHLLRTSSPAPLQLGPGLLTLPSSDGLSCFLALRVDGEAARRLTPAVRCMDAFNTQRGGDAFFEDIKPHVSIGWAPGPAPAAAGEQVLAHWGQPGKPVGGGGGQVSYCGQVRMDRILCMVDGTAYSVWSAEG